MGDFNQLEEQKQVELFENQEEQIQENQQLQEGNILEEKQEEETDVLNTAFSYDHSDIKLNKKAKHKSGKEKNKVETEYTAALKLEKSYAAVRDSDDAGMAGIREAMREYMDSRSIYKTSLENEKLSNDAKLQLDSKLQNVESKCNSYLRFRISFSKEAKARTAQVKELRQKVQRERTALNAKKENAFVRGMKSFGSGIKSFFKERVPSGFKGVGRSIKKSFENTFSNRSAGQLVKDFARDYIWGGIFRNAFNIAGMAVCLPLWIGCKMVEGAGRALNAISGDKLFSNTEYKTVSLPIPHLPSTWTRIHEHVAADKERRLRKNQKSIENEDTSKYKYVYDEDDAPYPDELNMGYKIFGERVGSMYTKKGTALKKTGAGYGNNQSREAIIERAKAEYESAEKWRKDNVSDDDDDQ